MPFKWTVDAAQKLIYKKVWGVYDDDEAAASSTEINTIIEHSVEFERFDQIQDLRDVSDYQVTPKLMRRIAQEVTVRRGASALPEVCVAYVVEKDLPYGLGRMYQAYSDEADSMTFRVYRSLEEVEQWLGVKISDIPTNPD